MRSPACIAAALLLSACTARADNAPGQSEAHAATTRDTSASAGAVAAPSAAPSADAPAIRALYVNRWATQSRTKMRRLIQIADSTEINALVLDMKDEFGLNYRSSDPALQKNAGNAGIVADLKGLLDTLKAHNILPIARIVVFKDSVAARVNPTETIRQPNGEPWRDKQGLTWVNPYSPEIREYNIKVAEELIRLGFGEIQYDYIRFPEPYRSLPQQVFPNANGVSKPQALADFLKQSRSRVNKLGVRLTADIFGLVTTVPGPLEIGQDWEKVAPVTDVLLPMVYPSHYPRGSFGVARPNAEPYKIIYTAIRRARERDTKLGITTAEHVRPWLQAFSLGQPAYDASHIREQKRAVYDAGYDGWVLWHPGSKYEIFVPALERTLVSRKKTGTEPRTAAAPRTADSARARTP